MREMKTFTSVEEFCIYIRSTTGMMGPIEVKKYGPWIGPDTRINPPWDTYIVTVGGDAVGFTDGPLFEDVYVP
jgi:hypothetical protein